MIVPLQVLAVGSIARRPRRHPGVLGISRRHRNWFEHVPAPGLRRRPPRARGGLHRAGARATAIEIGPDGRERRRSPPSASSWPRASTRRTPRSRSGLAQSFATAHRVLPNKYYVDELYGKVFVRGLALGGGNALFATDRYVVDGGDGEVRPGLGVNGIAWLTRDIVARLSNFWDKWIVDGA